MVLFLNISLNIFILPSNIGISVPLTSIAMLSILFKNKAANKCSIVLTISKSVLPMVFFTSKGERFIIFFYYKI